MSTIAGIEALRPYVQGMVQDTSGRLEPADYDRAIGQAVLRYSRRRPRRVVVELPATGGLRYPLPAPWTTDVTTLQHVELVGIGEPREVEARGYAVRLGPDGDELRFTRAPDVSDVVRLTIGMHHAMEATTSSIPAADLDTMSQLGAAFACLQLAALYSGRSDASLRADAVQHGSKAKEYSDRAKELFRAAGEEIQLGPSDGPVARTVAQGAVAAAGGEISFAPEIRRLTH